MMELLGECHADVKAMYDNPSIGFLLMELSASTFVATVSSPSLLSRLMQSSPETNKTVLSFSFGA